MAPRPFNRQTCRTSRFISRDKEKKKERVLYNEFITRNCNLFARFIINLILNGFHEIVHSVSFEIQFRFWKII